MCPQTRADEEAILLLIGSARNVSLERVLLALSGISEEEIGFYHSRLDAIYADFVARSGEKRLHGQTRLPLYLHRSIAKALFDYLWNHKPKRFGECFLLTDVIDAHLDSSLDRPVGTCVGLTSLYSVLGLRAGLSLSLLVNSTHLLNRLRAGEQATDMDHTDPLGFDCPSSEGFFELPLPMLCANVLNSRGLRHEKEGRLASAESDYHKAICVNPAYANAYNNRGNMKLRNGDLAGAVADYTEAVRLNPRFCEAYCNRGITRQKLGCLEEARLDYSMAMRIEPGYPDALRCLDLLHAADPHLGDRSTS